MIFVDTSFLFPLLSAHDRDHPRVREVFEGLGSRRLPDLISVAWKPTQRLTVKLTHYPLRLIVPRAESEDPPEVPGYIS